MSNVSDWKFITSTELAWESLILKCRRAQKSIDLEQYILGSEGPIIERLTEVLTQKVREGVRVRLLLDAVGSFGFYQSSLCTELTEAGIEIVFHKTIVPPSLKRLIPFFLRDHRKLFIFDDTEAHIGGVIIHERARDWRDTTVVFHGAMVEDCVTLFNTAWTRTGRMSPLGPVVSRESNGEFVLLGNSFRLRDKHLYRSIVRSVAEAKKSIYITTPYFQLTRDLRRALVYAGGRGVQICFLLPKRSDNFLSDCVGRFFYGKLLRRHMRIFHYTKYILHAKTISIDGTWGTVGSCNIDWLSMWLNYELNVVSENQQFALELESIFLKDLEESTEVTLTTPGWYGFFGKG